MTANPSTLTNTEKNLWNAIVSEALANLKYNAYAQRAMQEGHPEVAQIFQEVGGAETVHGINHLRVSGDLASTAENLRAIIEGEAQEAATIYPRMIREGPGGGQPGSRRLLHPSHGAGATATSRPSPRPLRGLEAKLAAQSGEARPAAVPEIPLMPASVHRRSPSLLFPDGSSEAVGGRRTRLRPRDLQHRRRRG